ncbi:MAG: DapH/DapD/GlmU-related protein [Pseudomonadota bacterium]|nr:DapH/DapD/GlmU-related protein [Pseudomonadota bacterium]
MFALAFGLGTKNKKGDWLEVFFPAPLLSPKSEIVDILKRNTDFQGGNHDLQLSNGQLSACLKEIPDSSQKRLLEKIIYSSVPKILSVIEVDREISSTPEAYLKLHLLSSRLVKPNALNLRNIFTCLPTVAWTSIGAIDPNELEEVIIENRVKGKHVEIFSIDKFPQMTNYVVPSGVRIAHSARIRLGAFLGEGTTVMHEGFVNFNAGTAGPNMVEGRISQGVIIGSGTDLGGSASTAGTLSGGGNVLITIGKDCLISANAGTGIPLGDRCTIEAGLYITPGTLVRVLDEDRKIVKDVKARELAGQSDMLFIRNSQSGVVECRTNKNAISLNPMLHDNN